MRSKKKIAFQEEQLSRLRGDNKDLSAELKALEIQLQTAESILEEKEHENTMLRDAFEKYMQTYSERVEALEEAERQYYDAIAEIKELHENLKADAEAQIARMRSFASVLN